MPVNNPFALVAGLQYVDGTAATATSFTGTVAMSFNGTALVGLRSDASDNLLVTGTLTHNNAAPIADNFGVLPAVASSGNPTYNAGDQVLLSTDLSGNLRVNATFTGTATNNITQWNSVNLGSPSAYGTSPGAVNVIGVNAFVTNTVAQNQTQLNSVALGSPSNYGTSPGAVSVQGVNAFITNTVPVTLTSTTITGTVAVTQSTSPWVVSLISTTITGTVAVTQSTSPWTVQGDSASGAAKAGNPVQIGGVFNTTQPTVTTGQTVEAQSTARGAQIVATGVDTFNVTVNTALPAGTNVIGHVITDSGSTTAVTGTVAVTQSTSPWVVSLASTTITGTVAVTQSTSPWVTTGNLTHNNAAPAANNVGVLPAVASTAAPTYTTGDQVLLSTDLAGNLRTSTTIGGTVAVTQSTSPWVVSLTSTTITGTVAVTQSGTWTVQQGGAPWSQVGTLTHNNAAPAANNVGALVAVASAAAPTYTTADQVLLSTDLSGNLRVTSAGGTSSTNVVQWNSVALGSPSNYGTSPGAVAVIGVNAFITNTPAVTLTSTTITNTVAENLTQVAGTALGATAVTNFGTAPAAAAVPGVNASLFAGVTGITATGSSLNVNVTNTVPVTLTSTTITGTVAVTQSTSPWVVNTTQWASTALGTPQTFGTAPTGVVIGTSSDIYIAGTRARSNQTTTAAGVMDVNIVGSLGATNSVTNGTFIAITDNTTKAGVIAATTSLKTDWSSQAGTAITTTPVAFGTGTPAGNAPGVNAAQYVGTTPVRSNQTTTAAGVVDHNLVGIKGTTVVTVAAGVQEVGIVGSTGATLDSTVASGAAPTNAIAVSAVYNTTQPAPTNGQATALQEDESGNLLTYPGVSVNTGAAWNSATTINTLQFPTGTATVGQPLGGQSVLVQLNQTTTLTGGAVTFQGSYDNGANWVTIPVAQVVDPQTYQPQTNPYTFQASTNKPFLILLQGFTNIRLNLTTLITGTGSVTPRWNVLQGSPVQVITSVVSSSGGTSVATGSIGATKTAIKTSGGNLFGWYFYNSNSSVAYVQVFNLASASVTLGTTAPTQSMGIPPGSAANMAFDVGISYGTAITIAITTTRAGATGPTNTVDYNIFYV